MSIIETSDGYTLQGEILGELPIKVVRVKQDVGMPAHIEGGIYFMDSRGIIVGQQGTTDPPEPFESEDEAWGDARDFATTVEGDGESKPGEESQP